MAEAVEEQPSHPADQGAVNPNALQVSAAVQLDTIGRLLCISPGDRFLILGLTSCRSRSTRAGNAAFSRSLIICRMNGSARTLSPSRSSSVALSRAHAGSCGSVPLRIRTRARLHSSQVWAKKVAVRRQGGERS